MLESILIAAGFAGSRDTTVHAALPLRGIRIGRALLRWSADELAEACALGVNTIRRAELTESQTSLTVANDLAVRRALETAGVEFIDANGGGPGVRLKQPAKKRT